MTHFYNATNNANSGLVTSVMTVLDLGLNGRAFDSQVVVNQVDE